MESETDNSLFRLKDLKHRIRSWKRKPKKTHLHSHTRKSNKNYRFARWYPGIHYKQIEKAVTVFPSVEAIQKAYRDNALTIGCFSHYRHSDSKIGRENRSEPRYAALFVLQDGSLIQPQQPHYRQCYQNSGRTERINAEKVLPDQTPYWCCIYADRLKSEWLSKKRYTEKKRRGSEIVPC